MRTTSTRLVALVVLAAFPFVYIGPGAAPVDEPDPMTEPAAHPEPAGSRTLQE